MKASRLHILNALLWAVLMLATSFTLESNGVVMPGNAESSLIALFVAGWLIGQGLIDQAIGRKSACCGKADK